MADKNNTFLGTGWGFPPTFKKGNNAVDMVSAEEDIRQSLEVLFSTKLGERIMQSDYGTDLPNLQFEPGNVTFESLISEQVKRAITVFEPRIIPEVITLDTSRRNEGFIDVHVEFIIPQVNSRSNLVFPIYLNEATNI